MCDRAIDFRLKMDDLPFTVDESSWSRKYECSKLLHEVD